MEKIDRIFISCDDNPLYMQFLPVVSMAWDKILGVKPTLAYVTDKPESEWKWINDYCKGVIRYPIDNNLPNGRCKTFVARLLMRNLFGDDICMVSDLDMLPLNAKSFTEILKGFNRDCLLVFGHNAYEFGDGDPKNKIFDPKLRKFPSCYNIATSKVWGDIVNPNNINDDDLVKSWYNIEYYDYRESVNKENFDDECLVRALIQKWNPNRDKIIGVDRRMERVGFMSDRLDRSKWRIDINKLKNGDYVDAHCPRPMNDYLPSVKVLTDYLGIELVILNGGELCRK